MPADVTLKKNYPVRNKNVTLSLTIGEGQFGTSDVSLDGSRIVRTSGSFGSLKVGKGSDIVDGTLVVRTVVSDVSSNTNRMSLKYKLSGGEAPHEFVSRGQVSENGELLIFEATFGFVAAS